MNQNAMTRLLAAVVCTIAATAYAAPPTPIPAPAPAQNVFVTNPATNPVKTTEAFPRTPVAIEARPESPYTVPADFRLVIETLVATVSCSPPATLASAMLFVNTDNLHDLLAFPLQRGSVNRCVKDSGGFPRRVHSRRHSDPVLKSFSLVDCFHQVWRVQCSP